MGVVSVVTEPESASQIFPSHHLAHDVTLASSGQWEARNLFGRRNFTAGLLMFNVHLLRVGTSAWPWHASIVHGDRTSEMRIGIGFRMCSAENVATSTLITVLTLWCNVLSVLAECWRRLPKRLSCSRELLSCVSRLKVWTAKEQNNLERCIANDNGTATQAHTRIYSEKFQSAPFSVLCHHCWVTSSGSS